MRCPFCSQIEDKVVDTRPSDNENVIRRRRECAGCGRRFTTYERIDEMLPLVIKKDGRREPFDRLKILAGLRKACTKRPVPVEELERVVDRIERELEELEREGDPVVARRATPSWRRCATSTTSPTSASPRSTGRSAISPSCRPSCKNLVERRGKR